MIKKKIRMGGSDVEASGVSVVTDMPIQTKMCSGEEESPKDLEIIYTINNHLYFYREITEESAALFCKTMTEMYFDLVSAMISSGLSSPTIELHINSPGGIATATFAMINKIKEIQNGTFGIISVPMKVNTHIEGESCSAGTLLSIVGSNRTISEYSVMLIHEVLGGFMGKKEELEVYSKNLELMSKSMKKIYLKHSKISPEELEAVVRTDLFWDAETCLKYGFVDKIV